MNLLPAKQTIIYEATKGICVKKLYKKKNSPAQL